jgi:glycine oxidase
MAADVIVVGGGVVGAACARALAIRGLSVIVLDPGPAPGASTPAAAGMLAPFAEAAPDDPMLGLAVRARDHYASLVPELEEETGISLLYRTDGIVELAFSEEEVDALREAIAWQRQSGFTVEWISTDELLALHPGVAPTAMGAALAPEDGGIDPAALQRALLSSAEHRHGATMVAEAAEQLLFEGERVCGVRTASGTHGAGAVVIAAGAWSARVRGLPRSLPVEPVRGQIATFPWPDDEPPAIVYGGHGYVMERDGTAIAGSTMERVGFDATTTPEGIAKVREIAGRIFPALVGTEPTETWAGLRPMSPDGRPVIGRDPLVPNLLYATGHGRNGILLAAMTGDLIAQIQMDEEIDCDLGPVDPARIWPA